MLSSIHRGRGHEPVIVAGKTWSAVTVNIEATPCDMVQTEGIPPKSGFRAEYTTTSPMGTMPHGRLALKKTTEVPAGVLWKDHCNGYPQDAREIVFEPKAKLYVFSRTPTNSL
jgi:hypothetical protein